ncbi:MAG: hypothetical protein ACFCVK_05325 [Acidimicrobiales bacterium]
MTQRAGPGPTTTEIEVVVDGGRLVVRKRRLVADPTRPRRTAPVPAVEAAAAEARWLAAARHPGAVALRRFAPATATIELVHAGGATMASGCWSPPVAARLLASACRTVTELHRRRLIHGKLTADHLVVAPSGRSEVVLCSPLGTAGDPGDDRRALAAIAAGLLEGWADDAGADVGWMAPVWRRPPTGWVDVVEALAGPGGLVTAARLLDRLAR